MATMVLTLSFFSLLFKAVLGSRSRANSGMVLGAIFCGWGLIFWLLDQGASGWWLAGGGVIGAGFINLVAFRGLRSGLARRQVSLLEMSLQAAEQLAGSGSALQASLAYTQTYQAAEQWLGGRHPIALKAVLGLAESRLQAGEPDQARALLAEAEKVIESVFGRNSAEWAQLQLGLARCGSGLPACKLALGAYRTLELERELTAALEIAGELALEEAQLDSALAFFEEILERSDPPPASALLGMGRALARLEREEQALDFLKQSLKAPRLTDRLKTRVHLEMSRLDSDPGFHLRKALRLLNYEDPEFVEAQLQFAAHLQGDDYAEFVGKLEAGEPVRGLLDEHPDWVDRVAPECMSPLQWAAWRGQEATVKLLLERKAVIESEGLSPLHLAAFEGHREVVAVLLEAGAKLDERDPVHSRTPLFMAVVGQQYAVVEMLAEAGAEVNPHDHLQQRPIHYAAFMGDEQMIAQLARLGADLDAADELTGQTALHVAVALGRPGTVKALLEAGAATDREEKQAGWTPLALAQASGKKDLVELLQDR